MDVVSIITVVLVDLLLSSIFLWVGMKAASLYAGIPLSTAYCSFFGIIKVCFISALFRLIPYVGVIASWLALFYFLKKETEAEIGEVLIMVIVSKVCALATIIFIFPLVF
ncbi:hypothetical protein [Enterovibrio norvegicus]|jgi:hypothetical protein|uniref:hypothetical protein n=1 Tax=Enterovibrio norvegicus TaxID=188144 RepID=UPI000C831C9D|nr:hypothetical protein [Enterovibrio norvegicus]PMN67071.1 hypothetical protein BCT27_24285 [Enterovibrio norvegicus]